MDVWYLYNVVHIMLIQIICNVYELTFWSGRREERQDAFSFPVLTKWLLALNQILLVFLSRSVSDKCEGLIYSYETNADMMYDMKCACLTCLWFAEIATMIQILDLIPACQFIQLSVHETRKISFSWLFLSPTSLTILSYHSQGIYTLLVWGDCGNMSCHNAFVITIICQKSCTVRKSSRKVHAA